METFLIVAKVTSDGYDREDLEKIEGGTFNTLDEAKHQLMSYNPLAYNNVMFVPLYEFCTDWNDSDDEGNYLEENYSPKETFISYVHILGK